MFFFLLFDRISLDIFRLASSIFTLFDHEVVLTNCFLSCTTFKRDRQLIINNCISEVINLHFRSPDHHLDGWTNKCQRSAGWTMGDSVSDSRPSILLSIFMTLSETESESRENGEGGRGKGLKGTRQRGTNQEIRFPLMISA